MKTTVNLEKELIDSNKKILLPSELLLVKEYDKFTSQADSDVLSRIGINEVIKEGKEIKENESTKLQQTKKFPQDRVFHISQIENVCNKYYLKFLPAVLYKGTSDHELEGKLSQFEIANQVTLQTTIHKASVLRSQGEDKIETNCYIAAPKESFKLQERPKDPLFFYKINDSYYYLVHKWGNDLSVFRRLKSLLSGAWPFAAFLFALNITFSYYFSGAVTPPGTGSESFWVCLLVGNLMTFILWGLICAMGEFTLCFYKKNEWDSKFSN